MIGRAGRLGSRISRGSHSLLEGTFAYVTKEGLSVTRYGDDHRLAVGAQHLCRPHDAPRLATLGLGKGCTDSWLACQWQAGKCSPTHGLTAAIMLDVIIVTNNEGPLGSLQVPAAAAGPAVSLRALRKASCSLPLLAGGYQRPDLVGC